MTGNPYWTFIVRPSHLLGNSRVAFPPEVGGALGCRPDALARVSVEHPAGCRKLLVSWERQEPSRTVIRRLAEPLMKLNAAHDQVVDLIVTGTNRVSLRLAANVATSSASTYACRGPDLADSGLPADDASALPSTPPRPQSTPLAPWGSPPTPLLPRWYSDRHGGKRLPAGFKRVYSAVQNVKDLRGFWDHYSTPLRKDALWPLRDMAQKLMPPKQLRVLPPNFNVEALDRLPLLNRTRNCVRRGLNGGALANGTVDELMHLPYFGIASLLDLMCVLEAAEDLEILGDSPPVAEADYDGRAATEADETGRRWAVPDVALQSDTTELIAAAAREFRGAKTLGDLLRLDLSNLIDAAGRDSEVDAVQLDTNCPPLAARCIDAVDNCLKDMPETLRLVAIERVASDTPQTLQELAAAQGLSRERMRQLDKKARADLEAAAGHVLGILALIAAERLGPVTTAPEMESQVVELLRGSEVEQDLEALLISRRMLHSRLGYTCRDGFCLDQAAVEAADGLKAAAADLADDEGLIDGDELHLVLGEEWHDRQEDLIRWIGWPRLSGRIALRTTARARVKAALLKLGAPATKSELAEESGLSERQVSSALSNIKSVARSDKYRWGLREWIDDVYEGIPAEIIQRINEDGGSTRLNRLLEELPRLFKVSETSVWAYLNTPAFRVEHGWVSETTASEFETGQLVDVVDGFTHDGDPYWTFEVAQRHLEGYSLHGVPPEIALALGCTFGDRTTASVRKPRGCQDISVIWRRTSMHGPEIGRLGPALQTLAARDATSVRLVIHDDRNVSFRLPDNVQRANNDTQSNRPHGEEFPAHGSFAGVQVAESLQARFGYQSDASSQLSPPRTVRTHPMPRRVTEE